MQMLKSLHQSSMIPGHIRYNLIITTIKFPKGFGAQTCEVRLYYNGISTKKMADFTFFM